MSVSDGQSVNAATVNASFVSKSADSTMTGKLDVTNTTDATGITDGAIHTDGGMGVEKSLHVGTTINATGNINAGANVVVTGDVSANDATLTGNLGAVNATLSGDLGALNVNATTTTTTNLFATTSSLGTASANSLSTATVTTTGNVVIGGDLTVSGTSTTVNSATLEITDASVLVNNGGSDATSEGAGIEIERTTTNAAIKFEDALTSKFKAGLVGSEVELANVSGAQTLTNKTIDSDNNTITNIVNADIKASAGIALDKLAATTASRALASDASGFVTASATTSTELGYVSGVTSAIQTQINSKIATADAVDISSTQLITGEKRFQNPIRIDELTATPGTPAAGTQYIYPKDDNVWYVLNSSGVETAIGSGGGSGAGGINFIDQYTFDNAIGDWATYANTVAGETPEDGTGGTANSTISRLKAGSINGSSLRLTKNSGSSRQGEGFSVLYDVGAGFRTHAMQLRFYYKVYSGTYTDDAIRVYIYDIANSTLIEPSNFKLKNHSLDSVEQICEFQNNYQSGINAGKYRVCFHIAGTDTNAYDLLFDYITIGPPAKITSITNTRVVGQIITTASTTPPTGYLYCNGATVSRSAYAALFTAIGTKFGSGDGSTTFHLPDFRGRFLRGHNDGTGRDPNAASRTAMNSGGNSGDNVGSIQDDATAKNGLTATSTDSGHTHTGYTNALSGTGLNAGGGTISLSSGNTTTNNVTTYSGTANITTTIGAGDSETRPLNAAVAYHIAYSSGDGIEIGDNYSGREIAARATLATNQTGVNTNGSSVKVNFNSVSAYGGFDTIGAYDTSAYRYNVKTSGKYIVNGSIILAATNVLNNRYIVTVYKNGSAHTRGMEITPQASSYVTFPFVATIDAVAGDYFEVYFYGVGNNSASTLTFEASSSINVSKLASPAAIASGEKVVATYASDAGQSIANGSTPVIDFEDVIESTHGNVTTGASWKFTAQTQGTYEASARVRFANGQTWTANSYAALYLCKNGALYVVLDEYFPDSTNTPASVGPSLVGGFPIKLNAGDYIDFRVAHGESAARTLVSSSYHNHAAITKK